MKFSGKIGLITILKLQKTRLDLLFRRSMFGKITGRVGGVKLTHALAFVSLMKRVKGVAYYKQSHRN